MWRGLVAIALTSSAACTIFYAPEGDLTAGGQTANGDASDPVPTPIEPDATPPPVDGGSVHPYVTAVLADAPVLYLRFGGALPAAATSPQVRDEISGEVLGTRIGDLGSVPGVLPGDSALELRGGSLVFGDRLGFEGNAPYTIELWAVWRASEAKFAHIVTKQRRESATKTGYALFFNIDHLGFERYAAGDGKGIISEVYSLEGPFRHVVVTYDGARMSLYVDGSLERSGADARSLGTAAEPFIVGNAQTSGSGNAFHGVIDELAIYDKALDSQRIRVHHDAAK